MTVDRFWELLPKKIFCEATEIELQEFEQLLLENPEWRVTAEALEIISLQQSPADEDSQSEEAFEALLKRLQTPGTEQLTTETAEPYITIEAPSKRKAISKTWWLFVAPVVAVGAAWFIFRPHQKPGGSEKKQTSQVITKPGSKTQVKLPDGSVVWLNASSNLTYDKEFGKNIREVNLTGEGYFDVVKDAAHPFIIHTKVIDVKVLGTQFNVRAYPNDAYTETSLIRGSVEVTVKNRPEEKHYLKPNEKVSVANNILMDATVKTAKPKPMIVTEPLTYYHVDSTVVETSWVENRLIFQENETFRDVALKMERWYGVNISFSDPSVAEIRPFGSFTTETVSQALDAMKESFHFNYHVAGNRVTITR